MIRPDTSAVPRHFFLAFLRSVRVNLRVHKHQLFSVSWAPFSPCFCLLLWLRCPGLASVRCCGFAARALFLVAHALGVAFVPPLLLCLLLWLLLPRPCFCPLLWLRCPGLASGGPRLRRGFCAALASSRLLG